MNKCFFIVLLIIQTRLFAQEMYGTSILFEKDSTKVEVQYYKKFYNDSTPYYNPYQKILLHKKRKSEEIATIGVEGFDLDNLGYKDNTPFNGSDFSKKVREINPNGIFYNDSTFSFGAIGLKHRSSIIALVQCKKRNGIWKINKTVELPIYIGMSSNCNVFFLSEDVAYIDHWYHKGYQTDPKEAKDFVCPYIIILGENNTYTKFLQEDKEYPPERPMEIPQKLPFPSNKQTDDKK